MVLPQKYSSFGLFLQVFLAFPHIFVSFFYELLYFRAKCQLSLLLAIRYLEKYSYFFLTSQGGLLLLKRRRIMDAYRNSRGMILILLCFFSWGIFCSVCMKPKTILFRTCIFSQRKGCIIPPNRAYRYFTFQMRKIFYPL